MLNGEPIDFEKQEASRFILDLFYLEDVRFGITSNDTSLDMALNKLDDRNDREKKKSERMERLKQKHPKRYVLIKNGFVDPDKTWRGFDQHDDVDLGL